MVLLKNEDNALPLNNDVKSVLMIGTQLAAPIIAGGGSGIVHEDVVKSPLAAVTQRLGVPDIDENAKCAQKKCNDNGVCVTYMPEYSTN